MEIKKRDIANFTGGVTTDDGRQLYGLDAETYLKVAIQFLFFFFVSFTIADLQYIIFLYELSINFNDILFGVKLSFRRSKRKKIQTEKEDSANGSKTF